MAQLATVAMIAGTVMSATGSVGAGNAAKKSADDEADQLNRRAIARRGEATAMAGEERRQARLKVSRARAVGAASGASLDDPTFVNLTADLEAEGEYGALTRMYEGHEEAAGIDEGAAARRREGKAMAKAGRTRAITTALMGGESLMTKYGGT